MILCLEIIFAFIGIVVIMLTDKYLKFSISGEISKSKTIEKIIFILGFVDFLVFMASICLM